MYRTHKARAAFMGLVNTRYVHTRYRHNYVTGVNIACTKFTPPNRLYYRHTLLQAHQKGLFDDVINHVDQKYRIRQVNTVARACVFVIAVIDTCVRRQC